jgi:sulfotransferase family protein
VSAPGPADTPAPFIVGMTRSGTTLLRLMLDAHPELAIPPETHFLPEVIAAFKEGHTAPEQVVEVMSANRRWPDFEIAPEEMLERLRSLAPLAGPGEAIRAFYGIYAEREGKPRWGDKTPGYATKMRRIWRALPEARFIHMIRDGRDVAVSLERRESGLSTKEVANRWSHRIRKTRALAKILPHYIELRYEDLVTGPEAVLREVTAFVELEFDPAMLDYHQRSEERLRELERPLRAEEGKRGLSAESRLRAHARTAEPPRPDRVGAWREELSPENVQVFERRAGKLLAELGYDRAPSRGAAE